MEPLLAWRISLALGLLIGLERGGHQRDARDGTHVAGARTFGLPGLLGGFAGLVAGRSDIIVVGLGQVGVAAAPSPGYVANARRGDAGATSLVAGMPVHIFGAATTPS